MNKLPVCGRHREPSSNATVNCEKLELSMLLLPVERGIKVVSVP
jgi:hypothetical protein